MIAYPEDLDMCQATFAGPNVVGFCRLDALGLGAVGRLVQPDRAAMGCRVDESDPWRLGFVAKCVTRAYQMLCVNRADGNGESHD